MLFKQAYIQTLLKRRAARGTADDRWNEIQHAYTRPKRHYHTLAHLEHIWSELLPFKAKLENIDSVIAAIAYHDFVYDASRQDNEKRSAEEATSILNSLRWEPAEAQKCADMILATTTHEPGEDNDTRYFTDADISILGTDWETYHRYTLQIRKEYFTLPDFIYHPGRKKVVRELLAKENIYSTEEFRDRYELTARENLLAELKKL